MSGLRVALVRLLSGDNWQAGDLIGVGVVEPRKPYGYVRDLPAFLGWATTHAPGRVLHGFVDYGFVRDILRAFVEGPDWISPDGTVVPFAGSGLAVMEGNRMRIRITPTVGETWESPLDLEEAS